MTPEPAEEPGSNRRAGADTAGDPIVRARGVEHSFDSVAVLQDIDVELEASAVTALVGPNGSGKTTLLRILAGVIAPDTGEVEVRAEGERPIGYLPQEPSFRGVFTVEETIDFYAALLSTTVDPDEVLKRVGLDVVAQRRVDALSGGMRRLLGLAVAILGDPPLVVLDEPASGLDPKIRAHVFDAIRDLADQNTAVLLATHHLQGAELAERVTVIDRGVLVADGTPDEILSMAAADSLDDAFLALVSDGLAVQAGTEGSV
ncbi:MAG: ABC-2 type transport system ATP-binding protein [Halobacteriales archaeon]|jgi:ABC-2 type transport system ATP-binding protein